MPNYEQLLNSFHNIETAIEKGIINVIANDPNEKYPSKYYDWEQYQSQKYPMDRVEFEKEIPSLEQEINGLNEQIEDSKENDPDKEGLEERKKLRRDIKKIEKRIKTEKGLKNHKGNFGIIIGYDIKDNGYWLGCLDIDGVADYENETKKDLYNILKQLKDTITVKTQSGGYHIYFLTKKAYYPHYLINIVFPKDYHIQELQNKPINLNNKPIELFTNNNRQVATAPSKIGKNEYKVISNNNDFNKLKPYDDIVKTATELFRAEGYSYKETEKQEKFNKPLAATDMEQIEKTNKTSDKSTDDHPIQDTNPHSYNRTLDEKQIEYISVDLGHLFEAENGKGTHSDNTNPDSENYQNMMDLGTELCILTNVYNLILPHVKLLIEKKIDGALEGELSASEDVFNYSNYHRYLTNKEMKDIADYLGLKYYFLHDDGFGYSACWTDNINEVCEDKHIKD